MHIGIAGLGRMGAAIALRLMEVGHTVTVWNRTPGKAKPAADAGAKVVATPAEVATAADVTLTILTDADAITAVYDGPHGLLTGSVTGKLMIDMSTVRPHIIKALAEKVRAKGAAFIDCPVGGTVGPARQGKLLGLAGGTPEDIARAKPLLDQLCRRVDHVGPAGAGAAMKLAINLPLAIAYQALGEAYILARDIGLDPAVVMEILAESSGGPNILKVRGPAIAQVLAGKPSQPAAVDIDLMRKDVATMLEEARSKGADLPLTSVALAIYEQAGRAGWGARDASALPAFWPSCQPALTVPAKNAS
jgi:3-hydroxyisobutyrate dehydrogenase